ncbi:PDZ domain-containing protein [Latilactobacillus sakei]|uniref:PDZ domain-containing protein n=1 Tax=Latilactobacillus sakei TaxID=1599 RepID=UPI0020C7A646|nr:PDZ domain-containing protein [Latilactobacillus sakei]MCP8856439.1 PDZ domain-containing protein [Latilactobacillus sakei]
MDTNNKPKSKNNKSKWLLSGGVIVIVAVAGGFIWHNQQVQATNQQIETAQKLVLFNPLATGKSATKLKQLLAQPGEKTNLAIIRKNVKGEDLKGLTEKAQKEITAETDKQSPKQKAEMEKVSKKLADLKNDKNFPKSSTQAAEKLTELAKGFSDRNDVVGLNLSVAGLQSLSGEATTFIQAKTEAQKKAAEEKKKDASALQDAVKNETYPSLGMLRGDLANGIGVIPMALLTGGPADNANFATDSDWSDSSVITSIDGKKVASAVIGDNSIQSILQGIKLGKKVEVGFKDGSTKDVELTMTQKKAASETYPELKDPGSDTDTDIYFGVSGYNMGQKNNNKEIGLKITDIYSDGSAAGSDLETGDIICRIDGYYVGDTTDITKIMTHYSDGDSVTVDYVSKDGDLKTTDVDLVEK